MGIVDGITIYVMIWLLTFFAFFFPWIVRSRSERASRPEGAESGAPRALQLARKVILAGSIAAVIWLVVFVAVQSWDAAAVAGGIATYLMIWWLTFFAVLPWGVRSQHEHGERLQGTEPGAPVTPGLGRKALVTSLIAAVIWLGVYAAVSAWGPAVWDYYGRIVPDAPPSSTSLSR
jgi:predicted secreted protein